MRRLWLMLGFQLLLPSAAGPLLGAVVFGAESWTVTKAAFLGVMPLLLLGGTVMGYVKGRPTQPTQVPAPRWWRWLAGDAPVARVLRRIGGSLLGLFVFTDISFAIGILPLYAYGLAGNDDWFDIMSNWLPAIGTLGAGVGLVAGYRMAR